MDEMLRSKGLEFVYITEEDENEKPRSVIALHDVDMKVQHGEFVVILGHNGSGKSTLAKHINALLQPTGGTLWIEGMNTADEDKIWLIRQKAGLIFQNPDNQMIASIVEEDVAFGPENLGLTSEEIYCNVQEALKAVGMEAYHKSVPTKMSGGQKQRIAIAGILAMKPKCIVLDEPTAMLDPKGRQEVMDTLIKLNKEDKITVIHITHYMEEAVQADRVIVMDRGQIILEGAPRTVFKEIDLLKKCGLDVPPMTELAHRLRQEGVPIQEDILTTEEMVNALCQLK